MANKKINELVSRTPSLTDLMLVGDPSSGYSYKCTINALATIIETDISDGYVTLSTTQTISGAKTFSNVLTLTSVANSASDTDKFLVLTGTNTVNYRTGTQVLSDIGGQGALTLTTTGTSGAATLVGNTLNIPNYAPDLSGYVPTSRTLTINGTSYDLSANRSWSVGTVTSVAASAGTGISISGSPITSSGTITITNTAPDQVVALTAGTGISVSGTYPNFTITNSSPSLGGTVTSVGLSAPTGFSVTGSPVTSSGTLALAFASGYSLPTTSSQGNWDSAYNNMIVSASVTGTTTKTLTLTQQDAGTITATWTDINTDAVTSVFGRTGSVVATEGDYSLTLLSDVTITSPTTGQVLKYNGTTWINDTDANTGTVTSVALGTGTTGTDINVSGSPITSSGTITLNIPTASASNRGALSSTDWSTFNAKQGAITLTTTGSSGAATFVANTLNIPNYTLSGLGGVPTTRTLTINGTAFDLSADRSWSVGTVTSVAATAGTGISISGSPITSSGTLTITNTAPDQTVVLTAGTGISVSGTYPNFTITNSSPSSGGTVTSVAALTLGTTGTDLSSSVANGTTTPVITLNVPTASATNRGALSSTDWSTFNNKQSTITLTTTGTSGSATFVSNTLNVPTYTLAGLGGISGSGTTNYIPKFTSSSAIGNSIMYEGTNGIGIGTTSPSTKLDILGSNNVTAIIKTITNNGVANYVTYNDVNNSTEIGTWGSTRTRFGIIQPDNGYIFSGVDLAIGSNTNIKFGTGSSNSERLRISSTGNVGIGTSNPAYTLQVTASSPTIAINSNNQSASSVSTLLFRNADGNGNTYDIASIDGLTGGNGGYGNLVFKTGFNTTNSEKMRLDASGNLGLGVSPSAWTSTWRAIQLPGGSIYSNAGGTTGQISIGQNWYYDGSQNRYINSAAASDYYQYAGEHRWFNAPSGTAGNAISFTQAMTLDASGRLGIGTTSPNPKLQITGGSFGAYHNSGSSNGAQIYLGDTNFDNAAYYNSAPGIGSAYNSTQSVAGDLAFYGYASVANSRTERMRIQSNTGNVGIGTTTPAYKLDVNGNISANDNILIGGGSNAAYGLEIGYGRTTTGSSYVDLIGGDATYLDYAARFTRESGGANANTGIFHRGTGLLKLSAQDAGAITFETTSSERMRITSGGDVGIGVTSPGAKLEVNGAIKTAAPSGYTAKPWKLGERVVTGVTFDSTQYIAVDIDGVVYYLATVTIN